MFAGGLNLLEIRSQVSIENSNGLFHQPPAPPCRLAPLPLVLRTPGPCSRGAGAQVRLNFLLCCRYCQAPLRIFSPPPFFERCVTSPRSEATPALRRLLCRARKLNGPPPPAPRTTPHFAPHYRLRRFELCPSGTTPVARKRHRAMRNFRATATRPMRRTRLPPLPKRSRHQPLRARSGW